MGQLQTNKAKYVVRYASVVESVDRPELAEALSRALVLRREREPEAAIPDLECLVQVDVDDRADEDRPEGIGLRGGARPEDVPALADVIAGLPGLRLGGLMCVAPRGLDPEHAFRRLAALGARLRQTHPEATALSMGMSADLEAAVRAGATQVRIGSDVLGAGTRWANVDPARPGGTRQDRADARAPTTNDGGPGAGGRGEGRLMAGALKKTMIYLGLADGDEYDEQPRAAERETAPRHEVVEARRPAEPDTDPHMEAVRPAAVRDPEPAERPEPVTPSGSTAADPVEPRRPARPEPVDPGYRAPVTPSSEPQRRLPKEPPCTPSPPSTPLLQRREGDRRGLPLRRPRDHERDRPR